MKRAFAVASVIVLLILAVLLHSPIREFLWIHPWWHSAFVALPAIALAVFDSLHSREANALRSEANRLRAELDAERNTHLQEIARNTARPVTQADRNADTLRRHLGAKVTVTKEHGSWGNNTPEIVEVSDDNILTLFMPRSYSSTTARCVKVRCGDLEITDIPQGSCPLRLKVLKRYGPDVQLGEITEWEDRFQPAAKPTFAKGGVAYYATYNKPGSSGSRSIYVYASNDGANSFLLEASTGESIVADNKEISKRFMVLQIEYQAEGFVRSGSGTGSSPSPLFVC